MAKTKQLQRERDEAVRQLDQAIQAKQAAVAEVVAMAAERDELNKVAARYLNQGVALEQTVAELKTDVATLRDLGDTMGRALNDANDRGRELVANITEQRDNLRTKLANVEGQLDSLDDALAKSRENVAQLLDERATIRAELEELLERATAADAARQGAEAGRLRRERDWEATRREGEAQVQRLVNSNTRLQELRSDERTRAAEHIATLAAEKQELLDQLDRLATTILAIPGEPSGGQGAVDTAIRILARVFDVPTPEGYTGPALTMVNIEGAAATESEVSAAADRLLARHLETVAQLDAEHGTAPVPLARPLGTTEGVEANVAPPTADPVKLLNDRARQGGLTPEELDEVQAVRLRGYVSSPEEERLRDAAFIQASALGVKLADMLDAHVAPPADAPERPDDYVEPMAAQPMPDTDGIEVATEPFAPEPTETGPASDEADALEEERLATMVSATVEADGTFTVNFTPEGREQYEAAAVAQAPTEDRPVGNALNFTPDQLQALGQFLTARNCPAKDRERGNVEADILARANGTFQGAEWWGDAMEALGITKPSQLDPQGFVDAWDAIDRWAEDRWAREYANAVARGRHARRKLDAAQSELAARTGERDQAELHADEAADKLRLLRPQAAARLTLADAARRADEVTL